MAVVVALNLIIIPTVLLISVAGGRILSLNSSDDQLISDGINGQDSSSNLSSCRHQYGFLPCAENAAGYIFLIVVYQVLLIVGDKLMGRGSDVLFRITGAEYGGIIFRVLRALPSMMVMILTGIFSDKENAQSQVSVVVGVYAGITVFSLTLQWFVCVVSASKPLKQTDSSADHQNQQTESCFPLTKQKLCILIENGVNVDGDTCRTAKIMLLSLIPYVVLQLVYAFNTYSGKRIVTLVALLFSIFSLVSYFVYQIRDPWMQKRSLDYSKFDVVQKGLMQYVERLGNLVKEDGTLSTDLIKRVFRQADLDDNKCIVGEELKNMVSEVFKAVRADINQKEATKDVLHKLDNNKDTKISECEFIDGFEKWIDEAKHSAPNAEQVYGKKGFFISVLQLSIGLAMVTLLAGPLMSNILDLSNAMNCPSFAVSFVVVPLAMNGRAALAALLPASKKRDDTSSRTFSEIYGGVIMNNIAGLTTLLAIVYAKELTWDFSAEVVTIMVVCAIIGAQAFFSTTYRLWTCIPAFLLYPISLGMFYFSQVFFGWN